MTESEPDRNRDPRVPPPASTEWSHNAAEEGGELPLPPFFAGEEEPAPATGPAPALESAQPEEPWDPGTPVEDTAEEDQSFPFDPGDRGAEEVHETRRRSAEEEAIMARAEVPVLDAEEPEYDFPVESLRLPKRDYGMESNIPQPKVAPPPADRTATRAVELADRLDRLSGALRSRGPAALTDRLAGGDRFDALLTGLLAGFLAAGDE
jgi:hypothetical protein